MLLSEHSSLEPVFTLRPHERNPREGDLGAVIESIRANGFFGALVAQQSTRRILVGNHRWRAAVELGMSHVPVFWVDVDDEQALRILLADNRVGDLGSYNQAVLGALLGELATQPYGLEGTGYDGDALDELLTDLQAPPDWVTSADRDIEATKRAKRNAPVALCARCQCELAAATPKTET